MNVLAIDGALGGFSAAVSRSDRIVASTSEGGAIALERGLSMVKAAMERAGVTASEIDRLAVGIGPGSFTGLRIGIAYAKALAAAWKRPLVPISSFDSIEFGRQFDEILAVVEGRPGVISARYRRGSESRRASGRIADVLDALLPFVLRQAQGRSQADTVVVGAPKDVLHALAERGIIVRAVEPLVTPAAAAAALAAPARTPPKSLHEVRADYGELPAVTLPTR
jgi:tRNA threonylcarbamoyladenosine biosynthesis protein TsaB